ncbi:MAG TPA: CoA-binding protein [Gaiellaceae bacterium]|nr:CoA-binding protein [Gaiellaceae bacterium]
MILPSAEELRRLYAESETIAVVGCSGQWPKPSHVVPAYMQSEGYRILPVNPNEDELLGERCVEALEDVVGPIDIVNVFRPAPEAPAIARVAVETGARCLWIQNDIVSEEAARIAAEGGLTVVMDSCIGIMHGDLGLGVGVTEWKAAREASWQ